MSDIKQYLNAVLVMQHRCHEKDGSRRKDWKYFCIEDFVSKRGQLFSPPAGDLPKDVPPGIIKECYKNCIDATILCCSDSPDYFYCEGYATGLIPMLHAWLVTTDGEVVDPTWPEPGTEYFGVAFKPDFVRKQTLSQGHYGLIDAWTSEWPLLKGIESEEWQEVIGDE
jgi:hypothetical protein